MGKVLDAVRGALHGMSHLLGIASQTLLRLKSKEKVV